MKDSIIINEIEIPRVLCDAYGNEFSHPSATWSALAFEIVNAEKEREKERARVKRYFEKKEVIKENPLNDLRNFEIEIEKRRIK